MLGSKEMSKKDWKFRILNSVLDSFLYAILSKKLSVTIDDILVDSYTIDQIVEKYSGVINQNAIYFYNVFKSQETVWFEDDILKMGKVRMGVLKAEGLNNQTAMIRRNGMKIKDQPRNAGFMSYMAVMIIEGDQINGLLRSIENPTHTRWEPERNEKESKRAHAVLRKLNEKIDEFLNSMNDSDDTDSIDPIVGGYLSLNEDNNSKLAVEVLGGKINEVEANKKKVTSSGAKNKNIDKNDNLVDDQLEEGPDVSEISGGGVKENGSGVPRKTQGNVDNGEEYRPGTSVDERQTEVGKVPMENLRIFCVNKSKGEYILQFSTNRTLESAVIRIRVIAETGSYPAPIISASNLQDEIYDIFGSDIKDVKCKLESRTQMYVTIDHDEYCSMEVDLYGN